MFDRYQCYNAHVILIHWCYAISHFLKLLSSAKVLSSDNLVNGPLTLMPKMRYSSIFLGGNCIFSKETWNVYGSTAYTETWKPVLPQQGVSTSSWKNKESWKKKCIQRNVLQNSSVHYTNKGVETQDMEVVQVFLHAEFQIRKFGHWVLPSPRETGY